MIAVCFAAAMAGSAAAEEPVGISRHIDLWGNVTYRLLQLVNSGGQHAGSLGEEDAWRIEHRLNGQWFHRVAGEFGVTLTPVERLKVHAGYRADIFAGSGLSQCNASVVLGDTQAEPFVLTGGLFRFRYNPDARNLGEYLIHSGCYPGYVFSGREWANELGLHLRVNALPAIKQDILVLTEMNHIPFYDFSLAYLGTVNMLDVAEIGAGVMFHRLIPVSPKLTTPEKAAPDGRTGVYTHRGIKVMGRLSLDIKRLFGNPAFFGAQDLKIYSEAAVLGLEDYPVYYEKIGERIPVMVGINIPFFGLLDYCALEGEWYGSPHNNDPPIGDIRPIPQGEDIGDSDDIKWSVSLRRAIGSHIAIDARAASDHLRFEDPGGAVENWEHTIGLSQWYWSLTMLFSF